MRSFKKTLSLLFALVMVLSLSVTSFAGDGNVTYLGGADKFIYAPGSDYAKLTDLFDNFKNVMPGDQRTQKILVKNEARNKVDIKIYMRSLGGQLDTDDFLSEMKLTVKQDGTTKLFEASSEKTAQLTDWVLLGTLKSGGQTTLDVTLDVPITMDNEFQSRIGYIDWQFAVEEIPVGPLTGDNTNLVLWMSLLLVSIAAIGVLVIVRKKQKNQ